MVEMRLATFASFGMCGESELSVDRAGIPFSFQDNQSWI